MRTTTYRQRRHPRMDSQQHPEKINAGTGSVTANAWNQGLEEQTPAGPPPPLQGITLGAWSLYFLIKFLLYWKGYIGFHALENLAFATFLLIPVRHRALRVARTILAVVVGLALLYHDTWLPSLETVIPRISGLAGFSGQYLFELAMRFINPRVLSLLVILASVYYLVSRYIRVGALVMLALVVLAIYQAGWSALLPSFTDTRRATAAASRTGASVSATAVAPTDDGHGLQATLDQVLRNFHEHEKTRVIAFPENAKPDFDLLILHICSLSWDDLDWAGLKEHPLLAQFDILFTHFNSAASYSGPAAIRVLRANCGQPAHAALYAEAPRACYLFDNLKRAGFETGLVLNHNGAYDHFLREVQTYGHWNVPPMPVDDVPVIQHAFDGSPIHDDLGVLSKWFSRRLNSPRHNATYYNTISLHDGNKLIGANAGLDSRANYRLRLRTLLDNLLTFFRKLEDSGRNVVVVMVPEHGAAVRGDKVQIAGLREIPTPAITQVPVGIRIFGHGLRHGPPALVDQPTSFLAISHVVRKLLQDRSFHEGVIDPKSLTENIPETALVSENSDTVYMRYQNSDYLRLNDDQWIPQDPNNRGGRP